MVLVHGDDYVASGEPNDQKWLKDELEKAYQIKTQVLGPGGAKEGKVLNRVVAWSKAGWSYEADPRHAELIQEQLGIKTGGGITTAGAAEDGHKDEDDLPLEGRDITLFRGLAARTNYLAMDRPDLQFAAKEICREMSKPMVSSLQKIRRVGHYLKTRPRVVWNFIYQDDVSCMDTFVDANWAACLRTRKSTSGGCSMMGQHCIKSWSKTQSLVAKSSGESELYGVIRGSTEALGLATLIADLGKFVDVRVHVDANAAKGMVERQGLQKVRHLEVDHLWLQEQQARRMLPLSNILGTENPADLMTKNVAQMLVLKYMLILGIMFLEGRAKSAAQLHTVTVEGDEPGYREKISNRTGAPALGEDAPDAWTDKGEKGTWVRNHRTFRKQLFTPRNIEGGPSDKMRLLPCRLTVGKYRSGQRFEIQDYWCNPKQGHRMLEEDWIGKTIFYVKPKESINGVTRPLGGLNSLTIKTRTGDGEDDLTDDLTTTTTTTLTTTTNTDNTQTSKQGDQTQGGQTQLETAAAPPLNWGDFLPVSNLVAGTEYYNNMIFPIKSSAQIIDSAEYRTGWSVIKYEPNDNANIRTGPTACIHELPGDCEQEVTVPQGGRGGARVLARVSADVGQCGVVHSPSAGVWNPSEHGLTCGHPLSVVGESWAHACLTATKGGTPADRPDQFIIPDNACFDFWCRLPGVTTHPKWSYVPPGTSGSSACL